MEKSKKFKENEKKIKKFWNDFKDFISRGNVLDLAVAVVVGGAFSKIVSSLVDDIIMPIIGILIGGKDFSYLYIMVGDAKISYGTFIQNIVNFLVIAFFVFLFTRCINNMLKKIKKEKVKEEVQPSNVNTKSDEVILLEEIRDLLKKKSK